MRPHYLHLPPYLVHFEEISVRSQRHLWWLVIGVALLAVLLMGFGVFASPITTLTLSEDGIILEYTGGDGAAYAETIPVRTSGKIRYFSAGTGLEERAARYPSFPLKLIFVEGAKAYVSKVAVTITDAKGNVQLQVPADQVDGPWLYVDLPAGAYKVTASREGQAEVHGQVTVEKGSGKTLYLRWKEARERR